MDVCPFQHVAKLLSMMIDRYSLAMSKNALKPRARVAAFQSVLADLFTRVAADRCTKRAALALLLRDNLVVGQVSKNSSLRMKIEVVAAQATFPIAIAALHPELELRNLSRGDTLFGNAGSYIDIVANSVEMRWWINDNGLTVDYLEPTPTAPDFVEIAGQLMVENFTDGRMTDDALEFIAKSLDAAGFRFLDNLLPSHRKKVAEHNKANAKVALKSFGEAIGHPRIGRRAVQKTLYAARQKYFRRRGIATVGGV